MTTLDGKVCAEGFYCPENSTRSRQEECTAGFQCPAGSPKPARLVLVTLVTSSNY